MQTAVGTLQALFAAGLTFDDVRDEAVVVCLGVTADQGYNGTLMCDGIIDNYGPHVSFMFALSNKFSHLKYTC